MEHPDDGLNDIRLGLRSRCCNVSLQIHIDRNTEASIADRIIRPTMPTTHNIIVAEVKSSAVAVAVTVAVRRDRVNSTAVGIATRTSTTIDVVVRR